MVASVYCPKGGGGYVDFEGGHSFSPEIFGGGGGG